MTSFADRFQLPFPTSTLGNRFGIHDVEHGVDLYGPQGHRGTDFVVPANTPVPVIANGQVVHVMRSVQLGNIVVVRHYLHGNNNDVYSGYCHLNASRVHFGQNVTRGAVIAVSGNTGTATTGAHVHVTMSHDDMGVEYGEVFDLLAFVANFTPTVPAKFTPKYTTAKKGEGLSSIAYRTNTTLAAVKLLNPTITAPSYIVHVGQLIRIA